MSIGMWAPAFRLLSPGKRRAKLPIFIFHRVLARPDSLLYGEPDAFQFDWMVRIISRNFRVLPFGQAVALLQEGRLPAAAACITFDDGYRDNHAVALPILQSHGVAATFFIATGFLDGGRMWNDDVIEAIRASPNGVVDWSKHGLGFLDLTTLAKRRAALDSTLRKLKYLPHARRAATARALAREAGVDDRSKLMMSPDEVRSLRAAGMEIGGHTRSHPILKNMDDAEAYAEISEGKREVEAILGEGIRVFAYPNGNPQLDLGPSHVEMLREIGFAAAATTEQAVAVTDTNPLLMPRFTPWDRTPLRFGARCALALAGRT